MIRQIIHLLLKHELCKQIGDRGQDTWNRNEMKRNAQLLT